MTHFDTASRDSDGQFRRVGFMYRAHTITAERSADSATWRILVDGALTDVMPANVPEVPTDEFRSMIERHVDAHLDMRTPLGI
jgi:hypothetical protein